METKNKTIWNEKLWKDVHELDSLKDSRKKAWSKFEETGFPTLKNEAWRYTSAVSVADKKYVRPLIPKTNPEIIVHLQKQLQSFKGCARLIFIDGWYVPQLSDLSLIEDSVDFSCVKDLALHRPASIKDQVDELSGFSAMNAALFQDGLWINVREAAAPKAPLLVYFLQTNDSVDATMQLRHWIEMGKGASLTLLEWHDSISENQIFSNHEWNQSLECKSTLKHSRFQKGGLGQWLRSALKLDLKSESHYDRFDFECGSRVSRNELSVKLGGEDATCQLRGIAVGGGKEHFDTQVLMNHAVPQAKSEQTYRNLLGDASRSVFGGCIQVKPQAQKTDASQVHKTLLMSKESRADTKPQLQIDADDVKCSHGAAIGQLSEDSLFYLQSRGISRKASERMLATGFVEHLLDYLEVDEWKALMKEQLQAKLNGLFKS